VTPQNDFRHPIAKRETASHSPPPPPAASLRSLLPSEHRLALFGESARPLHRFLGRKHPQADLELARQQFGAERIAPLGPVERHDQEGNLHARRSDAR
jgi:hypothetical protein